MRPPSVPERKPLAYSREWKPSIEDEAFLEDLERQGPPFFWEQGSPNTGQMPDGLGAA